MWKEIAESIKMLLLIPGAFVAMIVAVFIIFWLLKLMSPLAKALGRLIVRYVSPFIKSISRYVSMKIWQSILWAKQLLRSLVKMCIPAFSVLLFIAKRLAVVAASFLLWLLAWLVWQESSKPFLPVAIAGIMIGLPIAVICYLIFCMLTKEFEFKFKELGLAAAIGVQVIPPILIFLPIILVSD